MCIVKCKYCGTWFKFESYDEIRYADIVEHINNEHLDVIYDVIELDDDKEGKYNV